MSKYYIQRGIDCKYGGFLCLYWVAFKMTIKWFT